MGNLINTTNIGIDVAKDELVIFFDGDQSTMTIANGQAALTELAERLADVSKAVAHRH